MADIGHGVKASYPHSTAAVDGFARELGLSPSARVGLRIERERALDAFTADIGLPPRLRVVGDVG